MRKSLRKLLNSLDKIADDYPELTDPEVEDVLREVVDAAVIEIEVDYDLPDEFGLSDPRGELRLRRVLEQFIESALDEIEEEKLETADARLHAFQDSEVESRNGSTYEDYFGHVDLDGDDEE